MTRITSFKTLAEFNTALTAANTKYAELGRLSGSKVELVVNTDKPGITKTVLVSRNQLAKIALKLAEKEGNYDKFKDVKENLAKLDDLPPGSRASRVRQRISNAFFKLTHKGKSRTDALNAKENTLRNSPERFERQEMPEDLGVNVAKKIRRDAGKS